jgi:hypothetical protein
MLRGGAGVLLALACEAHAEVIAGAYGTLMTNDKRHGPRAKRRRATATESACPSRQSAALKLDLKKK